MDEKYRDRLVGRKTGLPLMDWVEADKIHDRSFMAALVHKKSPTESVKRAKRYDLHSMNIGLLRIAAEGMESRSDEHERAMRSAANLARQMAVLRKKK